MTENRKLQVRFHPHVVWSSLARTDNHGFLAPCKTDLESCEGVVVPSVAVAVDSHLADWKNVVASQTGGAPVVRPFHPSAVSPQVITRSEATMGWQKENVCGTEKRPQLC